MRIAVTADLHYGMRRSWDDAVEKLARRIVEAKPEVIILAGDVAVADPRMLIECLLLFSDAVASKLVVPGNHDIWTAENGQGADSFTIYEHLFPRSAELGGFHCLDQFPVAVGGIGFVGSMGWYDYGFADPRLGIPYEHYSAKTLPGVNTWNDGRFVRWQHNDESFTQLVLDRMAEHLRKIRDSVSCIVTATHHLPFAELLVHRHHRGWAFHNAFMGTPRLGELLLAEPKVLLSVCGHSHQLRSVKVQHVSATSIGSTYTSKRCVLYEIDGNGLRGTEAHEVVA